MASTIPEEIKNFDQLLNQAKKNINGTASLKELNKLNLELIAGKKSFISAASLSLVKLPADQREVFGRKFNSGKNELGKALADQKKKLLSTLDENDDWFDVTVPPIKKPLMGHLSPDTQIIRMMNQFFHYHGYCVAEGPEIETEEYNFEKTNLPKDHPARDLQDTIYIKSPKILLRTHTSSVEARIISQHKPPLRFVVPGVAFRNEIINPSNHAIFQQYQGVLIDKNVSLANLKAILEEFAKYMYGNSVQTRFRTKYYPEVEPGVGMDIRCSFCQGSGCRICKERGWIEILGSGIIHRDLLQKCGLDYNEWSGFAFGMGLDRIIMTKFGLQDIRDLHNGSLVFTD